MRFFVPLAYAVTELEFLVDRRVIISLAVGMKRLSTLLLFLLSYNLGYSYFSLDPNILEYGNLKFNKTLSGTGDVLSDSSILLNEGDVMIILRFVTSRSIVKLGRPGDTIYRDGLYVYTKDSTEDDVLNPVNVGGLNLGVREGLGSSETTQYLEGTYIVGPKVVCIAWIHRSSDSYSFYETDNDVNCEMDYAIQRKRTVNPQPVSQ